MMILVVLAIDSSYNILMPVYHTVNTGGGGGVGVNLPWSCGWSPRTPPIHILGEVKKNRPIYLLPISKIVPIHILFFKFYSFIYFLCEKDTPLIYFWSENDTHLFTRRPEKYIPSSRTSVYTFIMEVTPPPTPPPLWLPTPPQGPGVVSILGIIYLPPPRARGRPTREIGGNGPGSTKVPVLILSYCQVHIFPCRASPLRGQGTYPG